MEDGWWQINDKKNKNILKKEGINYVLWRIWWSICATRLKN